jgi:hypothetical protein
VVQSEIRPPRRVTLHGLPYFCGKLAGILKDPAWDVRYHAPHTLAGLAGLVADLRRCELAFTWGARISIGKFLQAARWFGKEKIVMLWSGSDVLFAQRELAAGKMDSWAAEKIHWAVSPVLAEEVNSMGLNCEYVQVSFVDPVKTPAPLPEKFSVLVYVPSREKAELYGLDHILEVASALPKIDFTLVGWREEQPVRGPSNLRTHGWASDLKPYLEQASVIWRPVRHDAGISFMVLEALAQGRHVLYSYPFAACVRVNDAGAARFELERLLELHKSRRLSLNEEGIRTIEESFRPANVRATLFQKWGEILSPSAQRAAGSLGARNSRVDTHEVSVLAGPK